MLILFRLLFSFCIIKGLTPGNTFICYFVFFPNACIDKNNKWRTFKSGNRRGTVEQNSSVSCPHIYQQTDIEPRHLCSKSVITVWISDHSDLEHLLAYKLELQALASSLSYSILYIHIIVM
jgi:hypothetical protein